MRVPKNGFVSAAVFVATAVLLLASAGARAQLWLDAAAANRPALGPARALGAVVWSHGRSVDTEDALAPDPPYVTALRDGGWDAFRFNRLRASDELENSARRLVEEVHRLKQRGYRKIVLAGQSFGGFVALRAADASDEVDAVIVTAPAAYGSAATSHGGRRDNAAKLYPLLEQVRRARIMAFYFGGDDYDPGGRGERTKAILAGRRLPHIVVDRPPGLWTHWAATTPAFSKLYGGCILGFLAAAEIDRRATCADGSLVTGPDPVPLEPRSVLGFAGANGILSR